MKRKGEIEDILINEKKIKKNMNYLFNRIIIQNAFQYTIESRSVPRNGDYIPTIEYFMIKKYSFDCALILDLFKLIFSVV